MNNGKAAISWYLDSNFISTFQMDDTDVDSIGLFIILMKEGQEVILMNPESKEEEK